MTHARSALAGPTLRAMAILADHIKRPTAKARDLDVTVEPVRDDVGPGSGTDVRDDRLAAPLRFPDPAWFRRYARPLPRPDATPEE
jgi:hypothetical protein